MASGKPLLGLKSSGVLMEFDPNTGMELREICVNGQNITSFARPPSSGDILLTRTTAAGGTEVLKSRGTSCQIVNRLPLQVPVGAKWVVPSDEHKALLLLGGTRLLLHGQMAGDFAQLIYVPFDGRPPIRVDAPSRLSATVSSAYWAQGDTAILFSGKQTRDVNQILLWQVPKSP